MMRFHAVLLTGLVVFIAPANDAARPTTAKRALQKQSSVNVPTLGLFVNPKDYGAIADGASHRLSSVYSTLAEAQANFPGATSLNQEIDYAAVRAASEAALGAASKEHAVARKGLNRPIFFPAGTYVFGDDTWTIRNGVGIHIYGAGRLATKLTSNATVLRTDGLWYSQIEGIEFDSLSPKAIATLDIDGNVPG